MNEPENTALMLTIVVDGQPWLEYDRRNALPTHQRDYLDRMDRKMDEGITLGADRVGKPDPLQRAQFVALHLLEAIRDGDDGLGAASCAYLASRLPDLHQVRLNLAGDAIAAELVFDEPYTKEVAVEFSPRLP